MRLPHRVPLVAGLSIGLIPLWAMLWRATTISRLALAGCVQGRVLIAVPVPAALGPVAGACSVCLGVAG